MKKLTVIDFFCGAGGFSEGFRQKGFKIVKGYDNWQPAINTYNHNFETNSVVKNILDFKSSTEEINLLPDTDIIIGSPPCVSFSSSNNSGKADKSLGLELTKCFLRIVAVKKHQKNSILKAWYMENVVNSKKYINQIYSFEDLNLSEWASKNNINPKQEALNLLDNTTIINSADYGSYQARKRAISGEIIKVKKLVIPKTTHSNKAEENKPKWRTLGELIKQCPSPLLKESKRKVKDPVYNNIKISTDLLTDHFYDSGLYKSEWRQSREHKINHYCMGKMSFPENIDKPSRTITATKSGTSREALIYKSEYSRKGNGAYRSPTVREAASIMGFPFTYQFLGTLHSKWRLVGNAVCPSVSRVLAKEVLNQYNLPNSLDLELIKEPNLMDVPNLNDFKEKIFDKQPKRTKNSRFRRHPIKAGNLTVTLSNFDIEKNTKATNKWYTSIQYGTGIGFKNQKIEDGFYKILEPIILEEKSGPQFVKIINNGFSEKIGSSADLQKMYEEQIAFENLLEPTELVEKVNEIITQIKFSKMTLIQNEIIVFKNKNRIPMSQVFALYAINKISTTANQKEYE
ncbi:DNA cytosine methyltransferase [Tenacibaculum aquimarinum]|uniref:DNA cytosine methyltransferase n=1 Tax=Tenacibaculum aquimarinum TaxID=2910675 RepID=UPI001F0AD2BD|nr:DNA cytosine methyltransferase [Tenacibaculum aquimarinum]MCH3881603.1 DNA cytosine methyltransferase [Tenacibaculum aquimarinum]